MLMTACVPNRHRSASEYLGATWYTWSDAFRRLVSDLRRTNVLSQNVTIQSIEGCEPYEETYSADLSRLSADLYLRLDSCVREFAMFRPKREMLLLRDMLFPQLHRRHTRVLFALIRDAMADALGNETACLYAPIKPESDDDGFPLHADLFLTERLFIVFDEVPTDGSGTSVFLTQRDLLSNLAGNMYQTKRKYLGVRSLLTQRVRHDSFDRLYSLLHGHAEHGSAITKGSHRVSFARGEGYLINDRHWLHGREPCSGRVSTYRFHRLTY